MSLNRKELDILEELSREEKLTLGYLSEKYEVSERNIRYSIDNLNYYLTKFSFQEIGIKKGELNWRSSRERLEEFIQSIDIDNSVIPIHGLHGRDRFAHHAELTVEIILHDITLRLLRRPAKQLLPSSHRHDQSDGEMVFRRHVSNCNALLLQLFYLHSLSVDVHIVPCHAAHLI